MLKSRLVGTKIGRMLMNASHWRVLRSIPFGNPEAARVIANDILADKLISGICPPNGTFLDIGAHIGSVLSAVHHQDPGVQIVAFEADPSKISNLRSKFPYCELFDVALGEREDIAAFQINASAPGYNTLVVEKDSALQTVSVRVAALDDVLGDRAVDVMKIDVEGAELGVLIGAEKLIQNCRPIIMFESMSLGVNALGYSAELLWDWLHGHGYQVFTPDRLAHDARPLAREAFLDGHQYPFATYNYFAVPDENRVPVRDRARDILGI